MECGLISWLREKILKINGAEIWHYVLSGVLTTKLVRRKLFIKVLFILSGVGKKEIEEMFEGDFCVFEAKFYSALLTRI